MYYASLYENLCVSDAENLHHRVCMDLMVSLTCPLVFCGAPGCKTADLKQAGKSCCVHVVYFTVK